MSEPDSPDLGSGNDTAMSVEDGAVAIEGLLSDVLETDSVKSEESHDEGQDNQLAPEAKAEGEAGDDDLELDDDTVAEATDAPDVTPDKAMKFAPDEAKVTLPDGTAISVAELKAGFMFQRTFTQKTMAHAEKAKAFEADVSQFAETKRQIELQREVILSLANELMPKEPQPVDAREDPAGYIEYLAERDAYQQKMNRFHYLRQSEKQEKEQANQLTQKQAEAQWKEAIDSEIAKLHEAVPKFKNNEELMKFRTDALNIGTKTYGLTQAEVDGIVDHRFIRILNDALTLQKALAKRDAKASATPAQPVQQPRIQQRQRMTQTPQVRDHASAAERLRKTGSIDDGAKALMNFV